MRQRLPNRRAACVIEFAHAYPGAGERIFAASIGLYDDGRVGEVFVHLDHGTSKISVDLHDAAVALSFAIQHGADLGEMAHAMLRGSDGAPHGLMGSLIDAVLRHLPPRDPAPAPESEGPKDPAPVAAAVAA